MDSNPNQAKDKTVRKRIILISILVFLTVYLTSTLLDEGGSIQKVSFLLFFHMIFIHISQHKTRIKEMIANKKVNAILALTFGIFVVMLNNFIFVLLGASFTNKTVHYVLVGLFLLFAAIHSIGNLRKD